MSMDSRVETVCRPMFGCHSEFDKYKTTPRPECNFPYVYEEKACLGCLRNENDKE